MKQRPPTPYFVCNALPGPKAHNAGPSFLLQESGCVRDECDGRTADREFTVYTAKAGLCSQN